MIQKTPLIQTVMPAADLSLALQLFGENFEVWVRDSEWRRVTAAGLTGGLNSRAASEHTVAKQLQSISDLTGLQFVDLNAHESLCLLTVPDENMEIVAVSVVDRGPETMLGLTQRAASAAILQQRRGYQIHLRLDRADSELAAWSSRMQRSQAERRWLYDLPARASLSSADHEPIDVAAQILPEMRRLIAARAVVFATLQQPSEHLSSATARPARYRMWQAGDCVISERVCSTLILAHGANAVLEPAVANYASPILQNSNFPGVLSCIVKEVVSETGRVGWILAINKDLTELSGCDDSREVQQQPSEVMSHQCGFGMFEASLVSAAGNALTAYARNCSLLEENGALAAGAIRSLVNAIDAKDSYTCGHSDRVADYARRIAATMHQSEEFCEQIYLTGLVHDVGKIGVPDSVLQKPDKLTEAEFAEIKRHPEIGHAILKELASFDYVLPGVLHHHEAVDGSGYPHGLKGDQIPLQARILAVADAYDAMTSDRPYRKGMPTEKAESIIDQGAGRQWDANCVAAFQKCIEGIRGAAHAGQERLIPRPACRAFTTSRIVETATVR